MGSFGRLCGHKWQYKEYIAYSRYLSNLCQKRVPIQRVHHIILYCMVNTLHRVFVIGDLGRYYLGFKKSNRRTFVQLCALNFQLKKNLVGPLFTKYYSRSFAANLFCHFSANSFNKVLIKNTKIKLLVPFFNCFPKMRYICTTNKNGSIMI